VTEEDRLASAVALVFGWGLVIGTGLGLLHFADPWRDVFLVDGVFFILGGAAGLGRSYMAAHILEILGCLVFAVSFASILFGL
jgi:hypothetical protein